MVLEMLSVYPEGKSFPFRVQSLAHGLPKAEIPISWAYFRIQDRKSRSGCTHLTQTATVKLSSLRVTARYMVSRSNGSRPASVISLTRSARRIPCGVVAPAS